MSCEKCYLEEHIKKYFKNTIDINGCNIKTYYGYENIFSKGKYLKGEVFLDTLIKNYCKKYNI